MKYNVFEFSKCIWIRSTLPGNSSGKIGRLIETEPFIDYLSIDPAYTTLKFYIHYN
jgi:hypothetical protein